MTMTTSRATGASVQRADGYAKVTGAATYSTEWPLQNPAYAWPVLSTVARGAVRAVDDSAALAVPGVLAVLRPGAAPELQPADDPEMLILQHSRVDYRGQVVAAVVATSLEVARYASSLVRVDYTVEPHEVLIDPDSDELFTPTTAVGNPPASDKGDVDAALLAAPHVLDATYTTPPQHTSSMEPYACTAVWDGERELTLYNSDQGPAITAGTISALFGLPAGAVRIVADYIGGGFGAKAFVRSVPVLAAMAAKAVDRPVKVMATRQQMFSLAGHRGPTVQRVRLAADPSGRLVAIDHQAISHTSRHADFVEAAAAVSRSLYATPNLRTGHRAVRLDVPTPGPMRAPGIAPGLFALESAMDELAHQLGIDPVELRVRNDTDVDPSTGRPFSSRGLVECLREGAERFGWAGRDPAPRSGRQGDWLVGTGMAVSTFPVHMAPSTATALATVDGGFEVRVTAVDIGTGARTVLAQVAADELGVELDQVTLRVAHSDYGMAPFAGGSAGTASWGWAVVKAVRALRERLDQHGGVVPAEGLEVTVDTTADLAELSAYSRHSYGAQFAEVRVHVHTGELRVPRLYGVFAAGRILNPRTARSQLLGGMIFGLSMALHEDGVLDPVFGDFANHDFAGYHIAANADVADLRAHWIEEHDDELNPVGVKGIGELSNTGTAAAIANAVFHATGHRVRDLPITLERLRPGLRGEPVG